MAARCTTRALSDTDNPDRTSLRLSQMTLTAQRKGKGKLVPQESAKCAKISSFPSPSPTSSSPSSAHSSSESESEEDSSEDEDEDEGEEDDVSQEYLDSLLEKARRSIASKAIGKTIAHKGDVLEEDIIGLDDPESKLKCVLFLPLFFLYLSPLARFSSHSRNLPPLDPGTLPNSYITLGKTLNDAPLAVRDLDAERVMESSSSLAAPAPPASPPELTKSGKPLTKKEKKAVGRSQVIPSMHCRTNTLVS